MKQIDANFQEKQKQNFSYYIDCHTHLLQYGKQSKLQLQQILNQAYISKVKYIVANTTCSNQYKPMISLYQKYRNQLECVRIIPSFGIHPCYIQQEIKIQNWKNWDIHLNQILKMNEEFCVGQIGLDFRTNVIIQNPKQLQLQFFSKQLQMAFELNRPVSVHCIRAYSDMLKQLKKIDKQYKSKGVKNPTSIIFHSYGGSKDITKSFLKLSNLNIYFSLSLKRSEDLCNVIPLQKLLFETDSPYQNNKQLSCEIDDFKTSKSTVQILQIQPQNFQQIKLQKLSMKKEQVKNKQQQSTKTQKEDQIKQNDQKSFHLLKESKYFNQSNLDNKPSYVLVNYKTLTKFYNIVQKDFINAVTKNALNAFKLIK